jgi:ribonucleoside-diphosphate reductase beta chain
MGVWAVFEDIHARSYSYVLENLNTDPGQFFDSIVNDEEIMQRMSYIQKSYDSLINHPPLLIPSSLYSDGLSNRIVEDNDKVLRDKIFESVVHTNITEGVSFYNSFAITFYFGYRGKMVGNSDIVKKVRKDEDMHVAITNNVLNIWRNVPEEGFQHYFKEREDWIYQMFDTAVKGEEVFLDYTLPKPLLGLNSGNMKQYVRWLANNRLASLGFHKKLYPEAKTNPIGNWLDSFLSEKTVQPANQEKKNTSYLMGATDMNVDMEALSKFKGRKKY